MLYLLDKDVRTVRWNGEPLHEATSAIVKETMNGDFTLTVKYPISDSEIYQLIQEDMLIKAPTPVLGAQLFRIKTPVEHNDYLEITAYHISDDIMQRSITPLSVSSQSCDMALSRMVQNTKTALGDFSFNSDIQERRTFNTTETETLYSVLLDGKHSIVGTWEGELVRDNFAMTVKKNRGENRGVVITTHKNLKDYQRTRNSQNVVTRIHAKSTFKPEGAETETTLKVTVDSPLINSYPYINEKEYENNNAKTVEELKKWAQAKFTNQGIDKVSDAIKIEAYELDGQVVHMGDTVNIKSRKHNVDAFKKAIAYEFDALKEEYISLTFDDKAGTGGSRSSGGLSNAADAIIGVTESAQEIALEKALQNADLAFDHQAGLLRQEILDGVELAKAKAEENKRALSDEIDRRFHEFSPEGFDEAKKKAEEALAKVRAGYELADEAKHIASENQIKFASMAARVNRQEDKLTSAVADLKRYSREETQSQITQRFQDFTRDNEAKLADYKQGIDGRFTSLASQIAEKVTQGGPNMLRNSRADDGLKYWNGDPSKFKFLSHHFYLNGQKRMFSLENGAVVNSPRFIFKKNTDYTLNFLAFDANTARVRITLRKRKKDSANQDYDEIQTLFDKTGSPAFSSHQAVKHSLKLNIGDFDNGYLVFEYTGNPNGWSGMFMTELDFYEGTNDRKWQPAPEDSAEPIEAVRTQVTQKLAEYKETSDGRFATISAQISGKVDQSDFQRVKETSQLYERILGTTEQGVADNASRLVMSSQIFQTEVKKITGSSYNLVFDPTNFSKWKKKQEDANVIKVQAGTKLLRITNAGNTNVVYHGFALPLTTSTFTEGEKLSYRIEAWVDVLPDAPLGIELWAEDGGLASDSVTFTKTGIQIITGTMTVQKSSTKGREFPLEIWLMKNGTVAIGKVSLVRGETPPQDFKDDTSTQDLVTQTKVSQLFDSYAIQTLTNAGAIASQINLNSNNILIEAAKIRLKGRTLLDEITAIDGYFKRLFVGDARIGTLNTDIIRSNSIAADKLIFDTALAKKLVSSDVFTDTLAAKTAFINKLRSVVVSATLLEGYKGRIGGFQFGTHDKDPSTYWLTGINQFAVGMSNGGTKWGQTALWVNWGDNWDKPDINAWYVTRIGEMYCHNTAHFYNTPVIHGNLRVGGNIYYVNEKDKTGGYWMYSPAFKKLDKYKGYLYFYGFNEEQTDWIPLNKEISDRRYKTNIQDSKISALDVIENLKTYSYRKEYDDKVEDISCGIMAQDVQRYAPEAFYKNPDGAYSYRTFELVPYLIKAIQELNQKLKGWKKQHE
ncbi:phage tail spike protein [Streptococcus sp. V919]